MPKEQVARAKAHFEKIGMPRYGWLPEVFQVTLHTAITQKRLSDSDAIALGKHFISTGSENILKRVELARDAGVSDAHELIEVLTGKKTVTPDKELTALVNSVQDKVAFAVHAWGFHDNSAKGRNAYVHGQRHLKDPYKSTEFDPVLWKMHPGLQSMAHTTMDEKNKALLLHGVVRRGRFEQTWMDKSYSVISEPIPQTRLDKLLRRQRFAQRQVSTPIKRKRAVTLPGLSEVTTLTDKPADIHVMLYSFPHSGSDDSSRAAHPPINYVLTDEHTYKKIMSYVSRRPEKAHALFERLAGEFPRKNSIFKPKKVPFEIRKVDFEIR